MLGVLFTVSGFVFVVRVVPLQRELNRTGRRLSMIMLGICVLVFATGALRNLNHMFGGTDVVNWVGFWLFAAAIAITVAGWYAARPILLAPIAKLFGQVSSR